MTDAGSVCALRCRKLQTAKALLREQSGGPHVPLGRCPLLFGAEGRRRIAPARRPGQGFGR